MISGASDKELEVAIIKADLLLELQPETDDLKEQLSQLQQDKEDLQQIIAKAIDFINGDLLYLANKCAIVYRNNIEVVAVKDRVNDLLQTLKGEDK